METYRWHWINCQLFVETWYERIRTGRSGISPSCQRQYDFGQNETRLKNGKHQSSLIRNVTAQGSSSKHLVGMVSQTNAFIVAMWRTDHLNARRSQPWTNESSFWQESSYVSAAQHRITTPRSVSARRHAYIVTNVITLRYVTMNKRTEGTRRWWQPVETMKASCQFW